MMARSECGSSSEDYPQIQIYFISLNSNLVPKVIRVCCFENPALQCDLLPTDRLEYCLPAVGVKQVAVNIFRAYLWELGQ